MARPRLNEEQKKKKITITLSPELYRQIEENRDSLNLSAIAEHAFRMHLMRVNSKA